jgi:hypothetical protein
MLDANVLALATSLEPNSSSSTIETSDADLSVHQLSREAQVISPRRAGCDRELKKPDLFHQKEIATDVLRAQLRAGSSQKPLDILI